MSLYKVASIEFAPELAEFASRRLRGSLAASACIEKGLVAVDVPDERFCEFVTALAEFMVLDLRARETARLISLLPLDLRDREILLPRVLGRGSREAWLYTARRELAGYLASHRNVTAEGFLRFRLPSVLEDWAILVDTAGEELLVMREYSALMQLFAAFAEAEYGGNYPRRVRLILHSDGTATVSDDRNCRIECSSAESTSLIGILMGLSPQKIEVYDLTEEGRYMLLGAVKAVFGDRVRFFTLSGRHG